MTKKWAQKMNSWALLLDVLNEFQILDFFYIKSLFNTLFQVLLILYIKKLTHLNL
jgi:hypothetical protein